MHIGIVVEYMVARGGTTRLALEWAQEAQRRGHQVTFFTAHLNRSRCYPDLLRGLKIFSIEEDIGIPEPQSSVGPSPILRRFLYKFGAQSLNALRVNILATKRLVSLMARHGSGVTIWNPHDYGPALWASSSIGAHTSTPVVWQCNDPIYKWHRQESQASHPPFALHELLKGPAIFLERHYARRVQGIMTLDTRTKEVVQKRYGVSPRVVRGAINASHFQSIKTPEKRALLRAQLGVPPEACVILCMTLLTWWRRTKDLVRAFSMLNDERAWLVLAAPGGDDETRQEVMLAIERCRNKSRIVWRQTPFQAETEQINYYELSDMLAFPNEQQTWGLAPLEAAAAGLALVVSRGSGVSEVLEHDRDALLFEVGDVSTLASHLQRLVAKDDVRCELALRAQTKILQNFTWRQYTDEALSYFEKVCEGTHGATRQAQGDKGN